jgi:NAD(P)-dependent dehydrogenase (short-subunit alcohol dehydrogenase family)
MMAKYVYFSGAMCKNRNLLHGKIAIITGANTGVGYETALEFAKRGCRVILACRDLKRANEAANTIINLTNNRKVEVELVDLSDLESIRQFCDRILLKLKRLDILVNNAGK